MISSSNQSIAVFGLMANLRMPSTIANPINTGTKMITPRKLQPSELFISMTDCIIMQAHREIAIMQGDKILNQFIFPNPGFCINIISNHFFTYWKCFLLSTVIIVLIYS